MFETDTDIHISNTSGSDLRRLDCLQLILNNFPVSFVFTSNKPAEYPTFMQISVSIWEEPFVFQNVWEKKKEFYTLPPNTPVLVVLF